MELFNLKHSVRIQYQVIFQVPTLIELDGLVTQFLHLTSIAQQLCYYPSKGLTIQRRAFLVYLLRMLSPFMTHPKTH